MTYGSLRSLFSIQELAGGSVAGLSYEVLQHSAGQIVLSIQQRIKFQTVL